MEVFQAGAAGDLAKATRLAVEADRSGVRHPMILHLVAEDLRSRGMAEAAAGKLNQALRLAPGHPGLSESLGHVHFAAGRWPDALQAYGIALKSGEGRISSRIGAAHCLVNMAQFEGAEVQVGHVLKQAPDNADALAILALVRLRAFRREEARDLALQALGSAPQHVGALIALSQAAFQLNDFEQAQAAARDAARLSGEMVQSNALISLGDALHALGRYDEAFTAWRQGKSVLHELFAPRFAAAGVERASDRARRIEKAVRAADRSCWAAHGVEGDSPARGLAFLVGFPRSGTTLLEQVLGAHPDVVAIDEQPTLVDIEGRYLDAPGGFDDLINATEETLAALRGEYWKRLEDLGAEVRGKVVIDKLPLRTLSLPVVVKLFPQAKILFAIRDPRDVVLGCFRRMFGMNSGMYEFTDLNDTARFYDSVMTLAARCMDALPMDLRLTRHERLVSDFEAETRGILEWLGLEWRTEVTGFADAVAAAPVNTPSSSQIVRGLNRSGFGQWRHYEQHMGEVLPVLDRWVQAWGYRADALSA